MSTIKNHDRILELTEVPFPSSDAPEPLVLANEDTLVAAYLPVAPAAPARTIIVAFQHCYAAHFGLPNDEAYASHPLAGQGLRPCGAFEVEHSSWVHGLDLRNRAHPRHDPDEFQQLRHWVWTFRESVLECASLRYEVVEVPGDPGETIPRMQALLQG